MPTVVAAAAAPAEATSPLPRIDRVFSIRRATTAAVPGASVSACGSGSTRLSVTTDDVNTYYRIANVRTGSTVTDVTASVLVQKDMVDAMGSRNPLTWTSATTDWSTPVREVSGTGSPVLYTNNGTRYYRYVSKLSTPVPRPRLRHHHPAAHRVVQQLQHDPRRRVGQRPRQCRRERHDLGQCRRLSDAVTPGPAG
ncbi:hypothetical protein ACHMXD_06185 [Micrococcus luteus]